MAEHDNAPGIPPFYASTGPRLVRWRLDPATLALQAESELTLPVPVHYVWPHPALDLLYVGASRHFFFKESSGHCLMVVRPGVDGSLQTVGAPVPLRFRPIHITLDARGEHLLAVGNTPPSIAVFRIEADGAIGPEVPQDPALALGIYPHQVRVAPDGSFVLVVERGNNAAGGKPEDPGALRVFTWRDGRLSPSQVLAPPGGGLGFGPRHADFHPGGRWMYLSIERQQQLQAWPVEAGRLGEAPLAIVSTLRRDEDAGAEQLAGAVHVHPAGHTVYVSNRTGSMADLDGNMAYPGGDNSMAVFTIDPATGVPRLVQNVDTGAYHFRTFSIAGDIMVASSLAPTRIPDCGGGTVVPAGFTVFRIAADGRLSQVHQQAVDTSAGMLFWGGFVEAYRAAPV